MNNIKSLSGKEIVYWANAKEMPAGRHHVFQKYLFEEWGIGSKMEAVSLRLSTLGQFIAHKDNEKAAQEYQNLRMACNYILSKININSYALACIIYSYDGQQYKDYSEAGLGKLIEAYKDDISQEIVDDIVDAVKKKLRIS